MRANGFLGFCSMCNRIAPDKTIYQLLDRGWRLYFHTDTQHTIGGICPRCFKTKRVPCYCRYQEFKQQVAYKCELAKEEIERAFYRWVMLCLVNAGKL